MYLCGKTDFGVENSGVRGVWRLLESQDEGIHAQGQTGGEWALPRWETGPRPGWALLGHILGSVGALGHVDWGIDIAPVERLVCICF